MTRIAKLTVGLLVASLAPLSTAAQAMYFSSASRPDTTAVSVEEPPAEALSVSDSLLLAANVAEADIFDMPLSLPDVSFMPPIFDRYRFLTPLTIGENVHSGRPELRWLEDIDVVSRQAAELNQNLFFQHPELVKYNLAMLPEAPSPVVTVIDPSDFSITVREVVPTPDALTIAREEIQKKHWIRTFTASLQFSQAYVSPNWYQGGNNNLNALGHIYYNVKLNPAYHPNLLFETTAQYKLGINNAPDDSIHAYNISDDQFQVNTTFGIKATKRWYYSFTGQFKTQLLNSYTSNSHDLVSALLSPGELTAGIGMTYAYANTPNTLVFNASIAPVSYNLVTCINRRINPTTYSIEEGHKSRSKFGSTVELTLDWKLSRNIAYKSRLFAFTDYSSFQADWENTLAFEINQFLTTQIYVHFRYDSSTPSIPDTHWKKLQIKEIFSIGFAYKFASI